MTCSLIIGGGFAEIETVLGAVSLLEQQQQQNRSGDVEVALERTPEQLMIHNHLQMT